DVVVGGLGEAGTQQMEAPLAAARARGNPQHRVGAIILELAGTGARSTRYAGEVAHIVPTLLAVGRGDAADRTVARGAIDAGATVMAAFALFDFEGGIGVRLGTDGG